MGPALKEALRSLCSLHGWSYAVLLSVDPDDPGLLIPKEAYHERQTSMVIVDTLHQIHRVGEGIIGKVALTGKHQWIFSEIYLGELCCWSPSFDHLDVPKGNLNLQLQFFAGIKTIAVISLPQFGVALFGSTLKVVENSDFINQVKHILQKLGSLSEPPLHEDSRIAMNSKIHEAHGLGSSLISFGDSNTTCKDIKDVHKVMMTRGQYSTIFNQLSNQYPLGSHVASTQANMLPLQVMPSLTCTSLSSEASVQFRNQFFAANVEAQGTLPYGTHLSHDLLPYRSSSMNCSISGYTLAKLRNRTYDASTVDQWPRPGTETKLFPSRYPVMSQSAFSNETLFQNFGGQCGLTSLIGLYGSNDTISNIEPYATSLRSLHSARMDLTCSSTVCSAVEDNPPDYKSLSKGLSFSEEIPAPLVSKFPEVVTPVHIDHSGSNPTSDTLQSNDQPQQMKNLPTASKKEKLSDVFSASYCLNQGTDFCHMPSSKATTSPVENHIAPSTDSPGEPEQLPSDVDLFDGMELDFRLMFQGQGLWDDVFIPMDNGDLQNLNVDVSEPPSGVDRNVIPGQEKGSFSELGLQHILDSIGDNKVDSSTSHSSIVTCVKSANTQEPENQFSASTDLENAPLSKVLQTVLPCFSEATDMLLSRGNVDKTIKEPSDGHCSKSILGPCMDDTYSMSSGNAFHQLKKHEESTKIPKKRARPGESTRPRPKDRQQIQDRVKELREIVPNGAKCSIDALLARTVNHMLFLQGVIKYADKIKQTDEPKMIGEENGVILRDSPGSGGGATWAYEVSGQTIVCPITVKELSPPGQMLIEILCEDRGSFLEIADSIRGFGLTILKGVIEAHDQKIWANFLVEANKEVTRMEIFLHLVQLLTKTPGIAGSCDHPAKVIGVGIPSFGNYHQCPMPIPISLADRGR